MPRASSFAFGLAFALGACDAPVTSRLTSHPGEATNAMTAPTIAPEGFARWDPPPPVTLQLAAAQPVRVEPEEVCTGETVTLFAPDGRVFPTGHGVRVLFSPCGVPGHVLEARPDRIRVKVPDAADSGPVWVIDGAQDAHVSLERGRRCLDDRHGHEVVPDRPVTTCEAGLDIAGLDLALRVRGLPTPIAFADDDPPSSSPPPSPSRRAGPPAPGEAPRCAVLEATPRGPITHVPGDDRLPEGLSRRIGNPGPGIGCFTTCEEIEVTDPSRAGPRRAKPLNHLEVRGTPRIERFLPRVSTALGPRQHRVEAGRNRLDWEVLPRGSDTVVRLSAPASDTPREVAPIGDTDIEVDAPTSVALRAENACGTREIALTLEPVIHLSTGPRELFIGPNDEGLVEVRLGAPARTRMDVVISTDMFGLVDVIPKVLPFAPGQTSAHTRVRLLRRAARMPDGAVLGELTAITYTSNPIATIMAAEPTIVKLGARGQSQELQPEADETLIRGRLRYRECLPPNTSIAFGFAGRHFSVDADGCLLANKAPMFLPVRRARIEIWDQAPLIHAMRRVVETDDQGHFQALVPAQGRYDVTAVASSPAGQVNFENDAVTWYWHPFRQPREAIAGGTLEFSLDLPPDAGRHFNALDVITWAHEFTRLVGDFAPGRMGREIRPVTVIPGTFSSGAALSWADSTHLWLGARNQIFDDLTILHEYGHHLQNMNGTYRLWPTFHDGCYVTVVMGPACEGRRMGKGHLDPNPDLGCWLNSREMAWFEGFPDWFAGAAARHDDSRVVTQSSNHHGGFLPQSGDFCPLAETVHSNLQGDRIDGSMVEDYLSSLLLELGRSPVGSPDGGNLSELAIDRMIFRIFFRDLRDRAPTIYDFERHWQTHAPHGGALDSLMNHYQMR